VAKRAEQQACRNSLEVMGAPLSARGYANPVDHVPKVADHGFPAILEPAKKSAPISAEALRCQAANISEFSMPMLAFLPWATVTERLSFGKFQIIPLGEALTAGDVPPPYQDAVTAILESYGHSRPVDRAHIPLLRSGGTELLADLK
jgi:hypothetical protein